MTSGWRKKLFEAGTHRAELALHGLEIGDIIEAKMHAEKFLGMVETQIDHCCICGEAYVLEEGKRCKHTVMTGSFL